jgi:hypothetical protein
MPSTPHYCSLTSEPANGCKVPTADIQGCELVARNRPFDG